MLDAVRAVRGRAALRPAETVEEAAADVEAFLVVPAWAEGESASSVASDVLRCVYRLDAHAVPFTWAVYAEGARRLGLRGSAPVPTVETGRVALA